MYLDNPSYQLMATQQAGDITYRIYIPAQATEYHMSRHIEATKQSIYAGAGTNEDVIQAHMDAIIERCNMAVDSKTFKTDIAAIATALKYRTQYPVDQHCAIRMGCILSFMEYEKDGALISEAPDKTEFLWLKKKEDLAMTHPDLYSFFLTWGATNVQRWSPHLDTLKDQEYLRTRQTTLAAMLPKDLLALSRA